MTEILDRFSRYARERGCARGHNEENRANIRVSLSKWPVFILYIARYGPTGLLFVSQPSNAGAYKFRDGPL